MYQLFLKTGHKVFLILEEWLNKVLTPRYNPLHFLGAIAMFLLWLVVISGFYIFLFYRIDAQDATDCDIARDCPTIHKLFAATRGVSRSIDGP